jgi:hypothetical protein
VLKFSQRQQVTGGCSRLNVAWPAASIASRAVTGSGIVGPYFVSNRRQHEGAAANCYWWWFRGDGHRGFFRNCGSTGDFAGSRGVDGGSAQSGHSGHRVLGNHTIPAGLIYIDDADNANSSSLDCDVLVVATKAYQVTDVLHSFADAHSIDSGPRSVLLLQNGWGSADEARAVMPTNVGIFSSTMVTGFERRELSLVNVNVHTGPVRIGSLFGDNPEAIHTLLTAAEAGFLPVVFEPNIEMRS